MLWWRGLGILMLVLTGLTILQNFRFNEESRHILECQVDFVERFTEALNVRTQANDEGRAALDELVRRIATSNDPQVVREALGEYVEVRDGAEQVRSENPYPEVTISEECLP